VQKKRRGNQILLPEISTILTENVGANKGISHSKFTDNVTNKARKETWKAITEMVNAVGLASRTIYEARRPNSNRSAILFSQMYPWNNDLLLPRKV